jgi:thiosulfate dehydrogenase [quinone] large subunit
MNRVVDRRDRVIEDPRFIRELFNNTRLAWIWVPIRLFVAYQWLSSGWSKFTNPAWMDNGAALQAYWTNALRMDPRPVITYDWYRAFIQTLVDLQAWTWFSKVIVFGELAVGIGLLLGAFTGIAALGGMTMNLNFMLAGSASTNPALFVLQLLIFLAWKTAGYYGLDRFLLPALGVPWALQPRSSAVGAPPNPTVSVTNR